jgi:hypothetical protein
MFNVQFDDEASQPLLKNLTLELFKKMGPLIDGRLNDDDIVTKSYLQTKKFHCSPTKIDQIVTTPGFPRMLLGDSEKYRYSLKAVDKWIAENQLYN